LAKQVNFDMLLGGHDHDPSAICSSDESVFGDLLLFKPGMNAYWLGVIDVTLLRDDDNVMSGSLSYGMRSNHSPLTGMYKCGCENVVPFR
jgi:2',3'-cyclic-nucleotide 2'-phosphodiesterase (5'-nucleotidase family)